jgi:hypothetical protein
MNGERLERSRGLKQRRRPFSLSYATRDGEAVELASLFSFDEKSRHTLSEKPSFFFPKRSKVP